MDAILRLLSCTSADTRKLRTRLAEMDRMAKVRNENKSDRKWEHVNRAALGGRPYTLHPEAYTLPTESYTHTPKLYTLHPAGPTSAAMARVTAGIIPEHLVTHAMRFDAEPLDEPRWTAFARPAVDCGTLLPGEARRFRVVLRNRNLTGNMSVKVNVEGCPCVDASFSEGPLAPGLPRIIEITAGAQTPGEWLGSINITVWGGRYGELNFLCAPRHPGTQANSLKNAQNSRNSLWQKRPDLGLFP